MTVSFIVVTASYNRPALLKRNIQAMLQQSWPHWRQIIVDDASVAGMQEALALAQQDDRITVIRSQRNQGCNATRNKALDLVKGEGMAGYVTFVDDDDYLLPDALEKVSALISQTPGYQWYTADCCYPDGKKASRLARHGRLSYLYDYMFGRAIKGDLNHFIASSALKDIRFTDWFRNGQEWSFYSQLSQSNDLYAFDADIKVVEYLEDGLTRKKVNSQERLKACRLKVAVLAPLVNPRLLSGQQMLLARELLGCGEAGEALRILKTILRYQWHSLRFWRYFIKSLLSNRQ